jgi:hypothetical protein
MLRDNGKRDHLTGGEDIPVRNHEAGAVRLTGFSFSACAITANI